MNKQNQHLTEQEEAWLQIMLPACISHRDSIAAQLKRASVVRDIDEYYYSVYFQCLSEDILPEVPFMDIELYVYCNASEPLPMVLNLYIVNGTARKFEIYNANLSALDLNVDMEKYKKELFLYDTLNENSGSNECKPRWKMTFI